jgi:hypothetical protein
LHSPHQEQESLALKASEMAAVWATTFTTSEQYSLLSFEQTKPEVPLEKKQLLFYFGIKFHVFID